MHYVKMVHGIRTLDGGKKTFQRLKFLLEALLENTQVDLVDYGYVLIPTTNSKATGSVIAAIESTPWGSPLTIVAYSNGCWATAIAMDKGYPADHLVLINPALNQKYVFPTHVKRIDVYYSPNDYATWLGKWYRRIVNLMPWRWDSPHGWGAMGQVGYTGDDPRVYNHNMGNVSHFFYNDEEAARTIANDIDQLYEENQI